MEDLLNNGGQTNSYMTPLSGMIKKMEEKGYTINFKVTDDATAEDGGRGKTYYPKEMEIVDAFRFEGTSDPADMAILYAIETNDGQKGLIVDAVGIYADERVHELILQIRKNKLRYKKI